MSSWFAPPLRKHWGENSPPSGKPAASTFRLIARLGFYLVSNWVRIPLRPNPAEIRRQIMWDGGRIRDIASFSSHKQGRSRIRPGRIISRHAKFATRSGGPAMVRTPTRPLYFRRAKSPGASESTSKRVCNFPDHQQNERQAASPNSVVGEIDLERCNKSDAIAKFWKRRVEACDFLSPRANALTARGGQPVEYPAKSRPSPRARYIARMSGKCGKVRPGGVSFRLAPQNRGSRQRRGVSCKVACPIRRPEEIRRMNGRYCPWAPGADIG